VIRWERVGSDVAVVPSGISVVTIDGANEHEAIREWSEPDRPLEWISQSWDPTPAVRMTVADEEVEAALVSMGALVALGVHTASRTDWYVVAGSAHAPAATLLSRSMGLADADEVGAFTDPRRIRLSTIANASSVSHNVTPRG